MISTRARNRRDAPELDATVSVSRATAIALSSICLVLDGVFWVANVKDIVNHEDPASLVIRYRFSFISDKVHSQRIRPTFRTKARQLDMNLPRLSQS